MNILIKDDNLLKNVKISGSKLVIALKKNLIVDPINNFWKLE